MGSWAQDSLVFIHPTMHFRYEFGLLEQQKTKDYEEDGIMSENWSTDTALTFKNERMDMNMFNNSLLNS